MSISLAIECSSALGSVTLGCDGKVLSNQDLNRIHRHGVNLLPIIDEMFKSHELTPVDLSEIYLSIGPGSFTGLRIAVAVAKTLSMVTGASIYTVPTLDVVVENAGDQWKRVAVGLNAKRGQMFTGLYQRDEDKAIWSVQLEPSLLTPAELLDQAVLPLLVIGDVLPEYDWPEGVEIADRALATPSSLALWKLAEARKAELKAVDAMALEPLYVRLPEAEEKWLAEQQA